MSFKYGAALLAVAMLTMGCEDGGGTPTPGDTGSDTGTPTVPTPAGAPLIWAVNVSCPGNTEFDFEIETQNLAYGARIYMFDTRFDPAYDEQHELSHISNTPDLLQDFWGVTLTDGDFPNTPDQTTTFDCVNHFGEALTYVAEVEDENNNVVDCAVWGHNPSEIIDGSWPDGGEDNSTGFNIGNRFQNCLNFNE